MTNPVVVWKLVDSCESCPCTIREMYGKFRCSENPEVEFQQNKDKGVPVNCPFRERKLP